jgi:hypothetical protein
MLARCLAAGSGKPAVPGGEMALIGPKQAAELSGKSQSDRHAGKGKGGKLSFRADDSGQRPVAPAGPEHGGSDHLSPLDGGRAGGSGRAAKLRAAAFAVCCACVAATHALAAHRGGTHRPQPPPTYSQAEVDSKVDQLLQNILSNMLTKQDLQNELGKFYTKSDVDGLLDQVRKGPPQQAVTRPELNAAITSLANEIQERDRQLRKSLGDQIRSLDDRTSTIPSWVSLSVSLVALCAAIWVGWRARVNATVNAAAIKARFTPRTERADRLVDEYASKPSERPGPTV